MKSPSEGSAVAGDRNDDAPLAGERSVVTRASILRWLEEEDPQALDELWALADETRKDHVGDEVHLRGLIEFSNHCVRACTYCGLRVGNRSIQRYRMTAAEILACAHQAEDYGYGTVVLQSGEDYGASAEWLSVVIRVIKAETRLAVSLSVGERSTEDLRLWRRAGADRYLLRFETSDGELYASIHPAMPGCATERFSLLRDLRSLGYQVGSGIMVGIPGQTRESVARDILAFADLDLDMIGVGPYIPHPDTPLGADADGPSRPNQITGDERTVYKAIALARLVCPEANIPSTTALATINKVDGRELGLQRGANVVMPNLTPPRYRAMYGIYPDKACVNETAQACRGCLRGRIERIGRRIGSGPGGRVRSGMRRQTAG